MQEKRKTLTHNTPFVLAIILLLSSAVLIVGGLASGFVALYIIALCAVFGGLLFLVLSANSTTRALKKAEATIDSIADRDERTTAVMRDLVPVIELLVAEDAAIVAAVAASRSPLSFPTSDAPPEERLREFLNRFGSPNDGSVNKARHLGSITGAGKTLREIDLRIPFIEAILNRVVDHTEKASMVLLERFGVISELTEKSDSDAKHAIEALGSRDKEGTGFEALIRKTHDSVVGRTTVINELLSLNKENAERVKKISDLVAKSEELITGIEDITERSKLIAFNMAVESARIGEKGLGFKVIVHELQRLNDQTTKFARDIMDIVKSFRVSSQEMLDQWLVKSEKLTGQVKTYSEKAETAVNDLNRSFDVTSTLFRSLSECAISINSSMSDILESLQFQDITRQQIEGASSFLTEIYNQVVDLSKMLVDLGFDQGDPRNVLQSIREKHERQLKVSKDHDLFDIIERSHQ